VTVALNPSAVDGTTISFPAFSWAVRPPVQAANNKARKAWVSWVPEIKMGVLFGRSPAGKQVLATWARLVVPFNMSLKGTDMSPDMRLLAVSAEIADSDGSESMAVGLSVQLG
jgi:hypothetical protein